MEVFGEVLEEFGAVGFTEVDFGDGFVIVTEADVKVLFEPADGLAKVGGAAVEGPAVVEGEDEFGQSGLGGGP